MTFFSKLKWILGIVLIFVLILTTNLIDRQNFSIVSDSVETIYADRLVAKDIIYDIAQAVNDKQLAYLREAGSSRQELLNISVEADFTRFATTKLTPAEEQIFKRLRKEFAPTRKAV